MGGLRGPQQIGQVLSVVDGVLLGQNTLFDPDAARAIRRLLGIASLPPLVDANPASQR
jgi:hypothetical protein